jgi:hypothetical protein
MTAEVIKFIKSARAPKPRRDPRPRLSPSIRALREVQQESDELLTLLLYVGLVAVRGHDPRALAILVDDFMEDYLDNLGPAMELMASFAEAWLRREARRHKLRPVE